ncbi:hypothetical protein L6Q21_10265 [Sandaracinobacter sp. RS1-74]|uniref:hypothetical protein n=1 Tax=Sandaracinobacteroides sayramensis TaxID=2913411 RepID=UPI001ED9D0B0|nr:hypothetical protein [Sandaracinobacteroides sayramensis]MCG2841364.1 hypothetical protein [Sandaracinobacteroides sayramensis]
MKADISKDERIRIETEQQTEIRAALVDRHFAVMHERKLDAELRFAHAVAVAPTLAVAWERTRKVEPLADDMPFAVDVPEPVVTTAAPAAAQPDNLRQRLGLS